jgi:catechol 2,3-dioxygenase-like lactoylglutathione lyase family enzyme
LFYPSKINPLPINKLVRALTCCFALGLASASLPASQAANPPAPAQNQAPAPKKEAPVKFNKVTPNLIVRDMEKSLRFYRDVLGFSVSQTVPDKAPFIFAWMKRGEADIFLNILQKPPEGKPDLWTGKEIGGTMSLYIAMEGVEELAKSVEGHGVKLTIPLHKEFYGMKEFAILDPDGYLLIFAERVQ